MHLALTGIARAFVNAKFFARLDVDCRVSSQDGVVFGGDRVNTLCVCCRVRFIGADGQ